jgi:hypothetical protein
VAEHSLDSADGASTWKTFSGDEIGLLLAHWQWRQHTQQEQAGQAVGGGANVTMLASTVSSSMLGEKAPSVCKRPLRLSQACLGILGRHKRSSDLS